MNIMLLKALIALIPAALLLARSAFMTRRQPGVASVLQLCGSACLIIVVLTHVAEALHIFPAMHWGEAHSAGHYLDLSSAVLAVTLLPVGCWLEVRGRRRQAH